MTDYSKVQLSAEEIGAEEYKKHLGGGAEQWEKRGAFQVELLRHFGLDPTSSLLDFGCGPVRSGVHFIRFLEAGNYRGVDYNPSFIEAAQALLASAELAAKQPVVSVLSDFELESLNRTFDFILCFSVLNHCDSAQRQRFFQQVPKVMHANSRVIVTHGKWFRPEALTDTGLVVQQTIERKEQLPSHLKLRKWGFDEPRGCLPIYEFVKAP